MPHPKRQPKPLRRATTYKSRKSIYAPSRDGSTTSLGQRLIVRRLDQSKNKGREVVGDLEADEVDQLDEDDEDEVRVGIKQEHRDRAKKAWETRLENELRRENERAERLVDADDAPELPSDELLSALHSHTSKFYTTHQLLLEPYKQSRARQWGSKKRMYLQTEGVAPIEQNQMDKDTWAHLVPIKRRRVMSVPVWARRDDEDNDEGLEEDDDEDEDEDEDEYGVHDLQEVDEGNDTAEGEDAAYQEEGPTPTNAQSVDSGPGGNDEPEDENGSVASEEEDGANGAEIPPKGKITGVRYKRRDMYKSMDGTAMLALGFLVEKFIASELKKAGYRPRVEAPASNERVDERDDSDE